MRHQRLSIYLAGAMLAGLFGIARPVRAQPNITPIVPKVTLTDADKQEIELWWSVKVPKLSTAPNDKDRKTAVQDLVGPLRKGKPSPAFLAEFALKAGTHLGPVVKNGKPETAITGLAIIEELGQPEAAPALVSALSAPQPAARLKAAKLIQRLRPLMTSKRDVASLLDALGNAGAIESDPLVLREIYFAIDFSGDPQFKQNRELAAALAKLLSGRATRLNQGGGDETADLPGFQAVEKCVKDADPANKKVLAESLSSIIAHAVDRAFDPQGTESSRASMVRVVSAAQKAIDATLTAAGASPPNPKVADELAKKPPDENKVRQALTRLDDAVKSMK